MIKHPVTNSTQQQNCDLTPMVDILFILIVFFLLTIGISIRTLDVNLPQSKEQIQVTEGGNNILLQITKEGYKLGNSEKLSFNNLKPLLTKEIKNNQQKLLIASDQKATAQQLLQLLAFLKANSIEVANILFENKQ